MVKRKRNVRHVGATLSAATIALLATENVASAHTAVAHPDRVYGTVTSVVADSVAIQLRNGTVETIATTPSTTYSESGTATAPAGVLSGEQAVVNLVLSDATRTASNITVLLDHVSGRVVDVTGSTVRLAERSGTRDFVTTASTSYRRGSNVVSGVADGELVSAFGLPTSATPSELVAKYVDIDGNTVPTPTPAQPVGPSPQFTPPRHQIQTTSTVPPPTTPLGGPQTGPPSGGARGGNNPHPGGPPNFGASSDPGNGGRHGGSSSGFGGR